LSDFRLRGYLMGEMGYESNGRFLRKYDLSEDQGSFATIVARHTNLVFSAVYRQVGASDPAADITQQVFIALTQNAAALN
jgi:DNA-directed RNA polymerase specialized sigma24 family protein